MFTRSIFSSIAVGPAIRSSRRSVLACRVRPALRHTPQPAGLLVVDRSQIRHYANPTSADSLIENLSELYSTARDEFEIAAEETEKKTVYAADDREAATEAFKTLKNAYDKAVRESGPSEGKEIEQRIGQRIRELDGAIKGLEEAAMED